MEFTAVLVTPPPLCAGLKRGLSTLYDDGACSWMAGVTMEWTGQRVDWSYRQSSPCDPRTSWSVAHVGHTDRSASSLGLLPHLSSTSHVWPLTRPLVSRCTSGSVPLRP